MSLDRDQLEKVRDKHGKVTARCPACAEDGGDRRGEHLVLFDDGKFTCAANPGDHEHRKRIYALAGVRDKPLETTIYRRPPTKRGRTDITRFLNRKAIPSQKVASHTSHESKSGTLGTGKKNSERTERKENQVCVMSKNHASQASHAQRLQRITPDLILPPGGTGMQQQPDGSWLSWGRPWEESER